MQPTNSASNPAPQKTKKIYKSKLFWGTIISLIILSQIILFGFLKSPNKNLITAQVQVPAVTPIDDELKPANLTIKFSKSVAPLALVGKNVAAGAGITLKPEIRGQWFWQDDNNLVFTPIADWPAGQEYSIKFLRNAFASGVKLASYTLNFFTNPFTLEISELKFYQSPVDPNVKQITATLNFNYPVNPSSLENSINLELQTIDKNNKPTAAEALKYKLTYDKFKRKAYLVSENVTLTPLARFAKLTITKNVKALNGPGTSSADVSKSVLVPDIASYFKVVNTSAEIIRNSANRPEQIFHLETTLGVSAAELNQKLHAYLLPKDYPATATESVKENYAWQNPGEVTAEVLKDAEALPLQAIPAENDYATQHNYKFTAPESRFIYVTLDKGLKCFGDYALQNAYHTVLSVPSFPKEISFLHTGSLLALDSTQKLSVLVRGVPAVKFRIARVLPGSVNHLVTQTRGNFSDPKFTNYEFNENNISEIFSEIVQFAHADASKEQYTAVDLAKYLSKRKNAAGPLGLFLLHAEGWDPVKKYGLGVETSRLILITDMGIMVKNNDDNSHDFFIESITNGTPVAGAEVSVLGANGLPIISKVTDANGHASFPALNDFIDERQPVVYLAKKDSDVSFIPYSSFDRSLNYSRFDTGGLYNNHDITDLPALNAFLFTERGIYRPGDTIHAAAIIRQQYATNTGVGLPIDVNIVSPTGVTVYQQKMVLTDSGFLSFDYHTSATAPTGQYDIMIYLDKDNNHLSMIGSSQFQLQEFLPDRLKIHAALSPEPTQGWIAPKGIIGKVHLENLFAAPATNRRISGKIILTPQAISFPKFSDYIFADPLLDPKKPPKSITENLDDIKTDANGLAEYNLNLERFPKATYQLTLFVEGFEAEGGRSVTTQTSALISPLEYLVGYKLDGDLSYIKHQTARSVRFLAIDQSLTPKAISNLKSQLFLLKPILTLVKKPDGTYTYQSLMQENFVQEAPVTITEKGTDFALDTTKIGDYKLVLLNSDGVKVSQLNYSVVGLGDQALPKNAELQIKLNKNEYAPGEDIELQINSPYAGAGLITIERDKVFAYQWFKTSEKSSIQKIKLPQDFIGNGYINVAFVRDWNSPEIFMSPLSFSIAPFTVSRALHTVNITLTAKELVEPGEPLEITYKTDKPGKIVVFAVDQGILQVSDYKTPDPLGFFFQKRALQVASLQILDLILPKFIAERELSAAGGDEGKRKMLISNLNPFKRKTDLPVVYWSGILNADQTEHKLVYNVPDYFNGAIKIMAVAVAANAVGSAEKTSIVRGDFVINPNVPTFVAPGDTFTVTAGITSNKDSDNSPIEAQLKTSPQLEIIGAAAQKFTLQKGAEKAVAFKVRAHDVLGNAELDFMVNSEKKNIKMHATLSIRPITPFNTSVVSGYANKKIITNVDRELYPEFREAEASISTSPVFLLTGLNRYLSVYPYGCTEQLVSQAWPFLAMYKQPLFQAEQDSINTKIAGVIQHLRERQLSSGGFAYWPGGSSSRNDDMTKFASVYAMHFLTEARARGFMVPLDMFNSGISYLKDLAAENVNNLDEARLAACAIYLLTRNEIITTNYLTHLQSYLEQNLAKEWKTDITSAYIAATYQLLKNSAEGEKIINYYLPLNQPEPIWLHYYNSDVADAEYLFLVAAHFPAKLPQLMQKLFLPLVDKFNSDNINTIFAGYASLALTSVGEAWQENVGNELQISEIDADNQRISTAQNNSYQKISIAAKTKKVEFSNAKKQGFFYQELQAGFDKNPPTKEIKSGIEVYCEYQVDNNPATSVELGKEIEVHLKLRALAGATFDNVAVVDLLPGGFEVVRESLKPQDYDSLDIREDRVIFFTYLDDKAKEIVYRIRATNVGAYAVPPAFAEAMYQPKQKAFGLAGKITVNPAK